MIFDGQAAVAFEASQGFEPQDHLDRAPITDVPGVPDLPAVDEIRAEIDSIFTVQAAGGNGEKAPPPTPPRPARRELPPQKSPSRGNGDKTGRGGKGGKDGKGGGGKGGKR